MCEHTETAMGQLLLADDLAETREQIHQNALTGAKVHAWLALAEAIRGAGMNAAVASSTDWQVWR